MSNRLYRTGGILNYLQKQPPQPSLKKLRTNYNGASIRVRRSSDNAELNIGFTPTGNLDTVTLLAFVGTGNGNCSLIQKL
jgi:hypothetical protein